MDDGKIDKMTQTTTLKVTDIAREAGVPSRQDVYKILKARSLQLQSGKRADNEENR